MSEILGSIIHIGNTEVVGSAGTFKKRLLVVKTNEQYPQELPIDFVQDKCEVLDKYSIGELVRVGINIRGNSYNDKWYCSLNGWKIDKEEDINNNNITPPIQNQIQSTIPQKEAEDDLPF